VMTTAHAVGLLFLLLFWFLPPFFVGRLAERKGRPFVLYLIVSLLIGWPIPLIAALVIRPHRRTLLDSARLNDGVSVMGDTGLEPVTSALSIRPQSSAKSLQSVRSTDLRGESKVHF
jgi:hypothetical protein